jgi:hypothetical protein
MLRTPVPLHSPVIRSLSSEIPKICDFSQSFRITEGFAEGGTFESLNCVCVACCCEGSPADYCGVNVLPVGFGSSLPLVETVSDSRIGGANSSIGSIADLCSSALSYAAVFSTAGLINL